LAAEVQASALRVRNASGSPVRITIGAIARDLDEKTSLVSKKNRNKLPLTVKALQEVLEGPIDFSIRRIAWATNELRKEGVRPGLYPLRKRAAVNHSLWYVPEIEGAFDKALQMLIDADRGNQIDKAA
jgi:DNA-directed RNA polymerase subunit K/omega